LGPVHGDLQGARGHRAAGGLPRRHPDRAGQARPAGREGAGPEDPRRPRRGPRAHRRARRLTAPRTPAWRRSSPARGPRTRAAPAVKTLTLKSPADLDAARELIAEPAA